MMETFLAERRSPFYSSIVGLGATMCRVGGDFISAKYYSGVTDEHLNTRANVGVQDLSTMGKMDIKGPDAEALVNHVIVNDAVAMKPGQVRYSTVCREDGGIMDDLTVFRLGPEHFMLVTGSVNRLKMLPWLQHHAEGRKAYVTDITAAVAFPTIQGPRSRELLKAMISDADLDGLKRWAFTSGHVNGTRVLISRTGVTGELGFELFVPADEAASVWDTLMRAGKDFGLKPYGVLAMFTLGLEKAYPAHGIDMDETRTPFHVGLDRWIKFDKGDFIGREALLKIRDKGLDERWTGLILDGNKPAATDARLLADGEDAGIVTYSDHGYSLGKVLATAHLRLPFTAIGTELSIDIDGRPTRAVVAPMPFFDPEGVRLRG
ncbi:MULTISPECIES: aminomethyltransferase family protein [Mesorhizobium]|uniref:Glycine cleavage system protein T n=2 Tax=Mesorhizobium TaxID=68287 RepID=A0A1A5IU06_RHILI|nr:aminomethyl transferase family protein [Mesorhizobium japonicum]OBP73398.1 glycine cleavage system protein T [Mesorhizobium loti]QGX76040.1 aminomethyl transferase family protein [Mesorhizobium japonicum R7A]MBE1712655.1 aminomethyl transferase family protein [Mesorhizobium japonicum]MUT24534.1 aminomethyl transferase family protein [Mesorhizobium japonicum]